MTIDVETALKPKDYRSENRPVWCAGCGDYGALSALTNAMAELRLDPTKTVFSSGIGCSSRLPGFVNTYGFHGVHGRALAVAQGVKLANPELTVIVVGGDGDGLSIGGNHFLHAVRRNVDITYILLDNHIYGLTKGQDSPTTEIGLVTKASPYGHLEQPIDPVALSLALGASFVARGFASRAKEVAALIREAVSHPGFALVHVISPCVTFNRDFTFDAVEARAADVPDGHDPTSVSQAMALAMSERLYFGVFLKNSAKPEYGRVLDQMRAGVGGKPGPADLKKVVRQFC